MFSKHTPKALRIYLKPILEALEVDKSDEWVFLWGEILKFDRFLESKAPGGVEDEWPSAKDKSHSD